MCTRVLSLQDLAILFLFRNSPIGILCVTTECLYSRIKAGVFLLESDGLHWFYSLDHNVLVPLESRMRISTRIIRIKICTSSRIIQLKICTSTRIQSKICTSSRIIRIKICISTRIQLKICMSKLINEYSSFL